jgi:outer membrane protein assembly factor BamB
MYGMKPNLGLVFFCIILGLSSAVGAADVFSPVWRYALGGAVIGVPAAQAESVAAVCEGGSVEAYSSGGRHLWSFNARGRLSPYLTRSREGISYVCRTNGRFIALSRTGRELWRINLGSPLVSPALLGWDGRIFIPTARRIDCYTASGFLLWSRPLHSPAGLPPQPDKRGGLVMAGADGELLILGPYGKAQTWKLGEVPAVIVPLDPAAARLLAPDASKAAAELVRAAAGEAAAKLPPVFDGNEQTVLVIYKIGRAESIRWFNDGKSALALSFPSFGFSGAGAAPLAAVNREDTIGAVMAGGTVLLFSVAEGRQIWSGGSHIRTTDTASEAALIYDERGIYVLTGTGATGYGADGKQLWTIRVQGMAGLPAFGDEGLLYSGGSDWVLYAYRLEDTVKSQKRSLYGPAAPGSYSDGVPRPPRIARYDSGELSAQMELIAAAIRKGRVGEDEPGYTAYLMDIAGSVAAAPMPQSILHPLVQVNYRVEAARLLAYIGSRETVPFLTGLFRSDPDPLVKAAAAEAIGSIGVDPDGIALAAFTAQVFPLIPGRDARVMAAIAAATGALCRFSGPPLSQDGTRLLSAIASLGPSYAQAVARRELQSLYH